MYNLSENVRVGNISFEFLFELEMIKAIEKWSRIHFFGYLIQKPFEYDTIFL